MRSRERRQLTLDPPQGPDAAFDKAAVSRDVRFAFRLLRSTGLLFLEDQDTDRHELLSYDAALRPAIVEIVSGRNQAPVTDSVALLTSVNTTGSSRGMAPTDVVDALLSQPRFQSVPLTWMEHALSTMVVGGYLRQTQGLLFVPTTEPQHPHYSSCHNAS